MAKLGSKSRPLKVAIVGSGPSGFYAAEAVANSGLAVEVNIIEKLPVPFGLVRYGVAPDHPKLKKVTMVFHQIAEMPNINFFGNVKVGESVSLEELESCHDAVILCYGAETDRQLNIPGEHLPGAHTATEFVAWYNGHPDYKDRAFDLSCEDVVIIGQGNVAADVCRILSKSVDELRETDIAGHAIEQLAKSKVRRIHIVGRRGAAQTKFTSRELKELDALPGCLSSVDKDELVLNASDDIELADPANYNSAECVEVFKRISEQPVSRKDKEIRFHFLLSPTAFQGYDRLEAVSFARNRLVGEAFSQSPEATDSVLDISCGLCFRSIGYHGKPIEGAPFDELRGLVPNEKGRVICDKSSPGRNLYVSGWIKRGPSGIIGTNRVDSIETIETLLADIELIDRNSRACSDLTLMTLLQEKGIPYVDYEQWERIDAAELSMGRKHGKSRSKFTTVTDMLIAGALKGKEVECDRL
jgi:ferredoxin--NADP+ reductase